MTNQVKFRKNTIECVKCIYRYLWLNIGKIQGVIKQCVTWVVSIEKNTYLLRYVFVKGHLLQISFWNSWFLADSRIYISKCAFKSEKVFNNKKSAQKYVCHDIKSTKGSRKNFGTFVSFFCGAEDIFYFLLVQEICHLFFFFRHCIFVFPFLLAKLLCDFFMRFFTTYSVNKNKYTENLLCPRVHDWI